MARCFCECGRPIGLASRRLNRQGRLLGQMLMGVHGLVLPRLDPEAGLSEDARREVERTRSDVRSFADEGTLLRAGLIEVLHGQASIRDFDHARMVAWIKAAGEISMQAIES